MNSVTVGVYPDGSHKINVVRPEHLEEHIKYNKLYRPGRALFVDGKCEYAGLYFKDEKVSEWEQKIKSWEVDGSKVTVPYK